jgi:hypothetical protein
MLFDTDGKTRLSTIKFGAQAADVSIGWREDGVETALVAFKQHNGFGRGPSPDLRNDPPLGTREFWPLDYAAHRMYLDWVGTPRIANTNAIRAIGGPANGAVLMFVSPGTMIFPLTSQLHLMIGPQLVGPFPVGTDSTGQGIVVVSIPNNPALGGVRLYLQVGGDDGTGFTVSNAAQVTISK